MDIRQTDQQLVAFCVQGDGQAGRTLVERHIPLAWATARHHGLSQDDASDICRQVARATKDEIGSLNSHASIAHWFLSTSLGACETSGSQETSDGEQPITLSESAGEMLLKRHLVRLGIDQLSDRCRGLFGLLYLDPERRSWQEIAERLDLDLEQIRPTRALCMRHLRNTLNRIDYPWSKAAPSEATPNEAPSERCNIPLQLIVNHVIGDGLDATEATRIKHHLEGECPTCADNVAWIEELVGVLDRGPLESPPPELVEELADELARALAAASTKEPQGQWEVLPKSRKRRLGRIIAMASATIGVLAILALVVYTAAEYELAAQPARVTAIQYSELQIKGANNAPWITAKTGQFVSQRASIRAMDGAVATIAFPGGAWMRTEWGGEWLVPRIEASRNGKRIIAIVRQSSGRASYASFLSRRNYQQQFSIRVPAATLELEGVATVETTDRGSTILVHQGKCKVLTADGNNTVVAGQTAQISIDQ